MFLISHNYEVFLKLIWKYLQLLVSVILNIPRIRFFEFITYCNVIFLYYWLPVLYKIKRITFKKNIYIYIYISPIDCPTPHIHIEIEQFTSA